VLAVHCAIQARERVVVTLGIPPSLLQGAFAGCEVLDLGRVGLFDAFKQIEALVDCGRTAGGPADPAILHTAFVSHAVRDEALLLPVVDYLRRYFAADLFLCADSILPGSNWQDGIWKALQEQEYFIEILSEASRASHFCSFEIGAAYALRKPLRLLSLDGAPPPAFVQHIQVVDLPRLARQRPWLDVQDVLVDELLNVLGGDEAVAKRFQKRGQDS
jgi:hypothetical protein